MCREGAGKGRRTARIRCGEAGSWEFGYARDRDRKTYEHWYEPGKLPSGKHVTDSTCDEIRNCIRSATLNKRYNLPTFNCRQGVDAILRQCGLTRDADDRWEGKKRRTLPHTPY